MHYEVTTPPTQTIHDWSTISTHLRLDETDDQAYVTGLQDVAIDFAQDSLSQSILTQSITAVYYVNDLLPAVRFPITLGANYYGTMPLQMYQVGQVVSLPRGPVTAITSVTDAKGTAITAYSLERQGYQDVLRIVAAVSYPVTVIYTAGYADSAHVPASIRQAILMHLGSLYENRESVSDKEKVVVPHGLQDFYRLKASKSSVA